MWLVSENTLANKRRNQKCTQSTVSSFIIDYFAQGEVVTYLDIK